MPLSNDDKAAFWQYIRLLSDDDLESIAKDYIWLYEIGPAAGRFEIYEWKRDACRQECHDRSKAEIYGRAEACARAR